MWVGYLEEQITTTGRREERGYKGKRAINK
jgi:hypothetical protein